VEYGYLWWTGETPASRRDGAFMAIGIHGQYLYVNPAAKIVIVVWGARPHPSQGQVVNDWSFCDAVSDVLARGRMGPE
jgi:CubicO group peptidase (beta-lactamase class C family)